MDRIAGTLVSALLCITLCEAAQREPPLRVVVHNYAAIPPDALLGIRADAREAFANAGVRLAWVICDWVEQPPQAHACPSERRATDLILRIVATRPRTATTLGAALQGQSATVYYLQVRDAARLTTVSEDKLMARVAIHELGHLLLGPGAHSRAGIMQAVWSKGTLGQPPAGCARFTASQAALIRVRVAMLIEACDADGCSAPDLDTDTSPHMKQSL